MKKAWFSIALLALIGGGLLAGRYLVRSEEKPAAVPAESRQAAGAANDFGFRMLAELRRGEGGNVFISPTSLSMALSMTYNGAAGTTKDGMATALGVETMDLQALNDGQLALLDSLPGADPKVKLTIANALWAQKDFKFLDDFLARNKQYYRAPVTVTDITGDAGVKQINAWVKKATSGKITDLLKPGDLNAFTRMVLTNAVYFKGAWTTEFDKKLTHDAPFTLAAGKSKQVPMMSIKGKFGYLENDDVQGVRLPYGKDRVAMYLLLPKFQKHPVDQIALFSAANWEEWLPEFREEELRVFLPRFKAKFDAELSESLSALGMADAFDEIKADFRGMTGDTSLFIKLVRHQAVLEVNEEGAEAAAATGVVMQLKGVPREIVFRADRPFLCAIRDDETGALLFLGIINNPE